MKVHKITKVLLCNKFNKETKKDNSKKFKDDSFQKILNLEIEKLRKQ